MRFRHFVISDFLVLFFSLSIEGEGKGLGLVAEGSTGCSRCVSLWPW